MCLHLVNTKPLPAVAAPLQLQQPGPVLPDQNEAVPLPGFHHYTINPAGEIFYKGILKKPRLKAGQAPKVRMQQGSKRRDMGLATLLAQAFLPNPQQHSRIIFKDGKPQNCCLQNIAWASQQLYSRYSLHRHKPIGQTASKRKEKPNPAEAGAIPVPGCPGISITTAATVFRNGRQINLRQKKGRQPVVSYIHKGKTASWPLLQLMAMAYIPNPQQHPYCIFKDGDPRHISLQNIAWVSVQEYHAHNAAIRAGLNISNLPQKKPATRPIPGYPGYSISADADIYMGKLPLPLPAVQAGKAARVRLYDNKDEAHRCQLARLVALAWLANPHKNTLLIHKDHNKHNCKVANLQWVTASGYRRFINRIIEDASLLDAAPPPPKPVPSPDPQRVPLEGFPGYYISPSGKVYKGDKAISIRYAKNKAPIVRLRLAGSLSRCYYLGLASLLAKHFIANPRNHRYVIFKDRNHHNCTMENIAWVDAETFTYYCTAHVGGKKIQGSREDAISRCTNEHLVMYYKTGDEAWLHECWQTIEARMWIADWNELRAECYCYLLDRARRYSLYKDPLGMLLYHIKGLRKKLRAEISPNMPMGKLLNSDESLRSIGNGTAGTFGL